MTLVTLPSATAMSSPCNGPKWNRCTALARASALRALLTPRSKRILPPRMGVGQIVAERSPGRASPAGGLSIRDPGSSAVPG
jgi:hypothetical protein